MRDEKQQSVVSPIELVVMWCAMTFNWVIKGRRRCKAVIDNQITQGAVNAFKKNLWLTKFRYQPDHWAYRDFKKNVLQKSVVNRRSEQRPLTT